MSPAEKRNLVKEMKREGLTAREIYDRTAIPISTINVYIGQLVAAREIEPGKPGRKRSQKSIENEIENWIKKHLNSGWTNTQIARKFGIEISQVIAIKNRLKTEAISR